MDTQTLTSYFQERLTQLPQLRQATELSDGMEFKKWWVTINSTLQRMGEDYSRKALGIRFSPVIRRGYPDEVTERQAYQRGLDNAESMLNALIEELNMWGYEGVKRQEMEGGKTPAIAFNVTMSQKQVQGINQRIDVNQFPPEVKEKLELLLDELKKEDKDIAKVRDVIKWLADKSVDALIAVVLASINP